MGAAAGAAMGAGGGMSMMRNMANMVRSKKYRKMDDAQLRALFDKGGRHASLIGAEIQRRQGLGDFGLSGGSAGAGSVGVGNEGKIDEVLAGVDEIKEAVGVSSTPSEVVDPAAVAAEETVASQNAPIDALTAPVETGSFTPSQQENALNIFGSEDARQRAIGA